MAAIVPLKTETTQRRRIWHVCSGPLTRRRYLDFIKGAYDAGRKVPVHVQVRHLGVVTCGVVQDTREGVGRPFDYFQVQTEMFGLLWVTHTSVRMCGGDPRCTCEAGSGCGAPVSAARRPADVAPLGNTGVTP